MPTQATALFADRHSAHAAIEQLVQAGFPRDNISVIMSLETFEREFGPPSPSRSGVRSARYAGVLGAIVDGLVAMSAAGGVALRAAGPMVQRILRAGERTVADLSEGFVAAGLTEREARLVIDGMRGGALVVGVEAADRAMLALQLLKLSGGDALQAA